MRPGIKPDNLLEWAVLFSGMAPVPLMESFWGYALARAVLAGLRLGVFEALVPGPETSASVAAAIKCDPDATGLLLDALNGFGYLRRRGGRYWLAGKARRWLVSSAPADMSEALLFIGELSKMMDGLEDSVRTGRTVNFHHLGKPDEFWAHYLRGLGSFVNFAGPAIVRSVPFRRPPRRLLDVGGGHGMYSLAFCRKYPGLTADVLDLPAAVAQGREIIRGRSDGDRVRFIEGDLRTADWGTGYDAVLLFNIVHNLTEEENRQAFAKAHACLNAGGAVVVEDGRHAGTGGDLDAVSGFSGLLFFHLSSCRLYTEAEIACWLRLAGFPRPHKRLLRAMPAILLLSAQK
ncbi:MAG: class I SAM-dependent methyltransferase [Candidatus Edwardsbacteria bacterium]|nr:class I SAM-dependent methyltransferase [Candidatus Edwardsbacteria bacterium]